MAAQLATSASAVSALKELYVDDQSFMKDMVYAQNPFMALVPKNEDADGLAG